MKISQKGFIVPLLILLVVVIAIIIGAFLFLQSSLPSAFSNNSPAAPPQNLLTLSCGASSFVISGEPFNSTNYPFAHDYKIKVSILLNGKLVQKDTVDKTWSVIYPPILQSYKDKYASTSVYFLPEPNLSSWQSSVNYLSIYVSSKNFSETEYRGFVDCVKNNQQTIDSALSKTYTIQVGTSEFPATTFYQGILMVAYGNPYSDTILNCPDEAGYVTSINPVGFVIQTDPGSSGMVGNIILDGGREVWQAEFPLNNAKLNSCTLPDGTNFLQKYPPV